jgi:hypothetical protein
MMGDIMIEGVAVKMGGETFIVPPLNFKRLRKLKPILEKVKTSAPGGDMSDEQFDASVDIVHTALARNYPDLERERVEELLDLGNMTKVMAAVMGQSGLVQGE